MPIVDIGFRLEDVQRIIPSRRIWGQQQAKERCKEIPHRGSVKLY